MKRVELLPILLILGSARPAWPSEVRVEVLSAPTANVNAFVISDSAGSLIVDATRTSRDAAEVAKIARKHGGGGPKAIFITHGHPDHYLGMGALKKEFPDARILVASQDVKDDIVRFAAAAERGHWLEDEPVMKPRSKENPTGFDYSNEIQILSGNTLELPGGSKIEVLKNFPPTEAAHETLLFSKDLNALFASDLVYSGVHLWLAGGVDESAVRNWRNELKGLKARYGPLKTKIYPGHGEETDSRVFDIDLRYMKEFMAIVKESKTQETAQKRLIGKYPAWKNADFILVQSIKSWFGLLKK